ncbi:MAG: DUF2474 family protein [Rhodospirillales bacterium]|nr:DUF2474 family protein [Rhodospirillales bacterium]MDE2200077.1 DUF2474 family protein [Rhodospirillales bacterium]MDE2574471.1 DUF2474 family protein [Rhodospirillales bacterium]
MPTGCSAARCGRARITTERRAKGRTPRRLLWFVGLYAASVGAALALAALLRLALRH